MSDEVQQIGHWLCYEAAQDKADLERLRDNGSMNNGAMWQWQHTIDMKLGIADDIERGLHLAGERK